MNRLQAILVALGILALGVVSGIFLATWWQGVIAGLIVGGVFYVLYELGSLRRGWLFLLLAVLIGLVVLFWFPLTGWIGGIKLFNPTTKAPATQAPAGALTEEQIIATVDARVAEALKALVTPTPGGPGATEEVVVYTVSSTVGPFLTEEAVQKIEREMPINVGLPIHSDAAPNDQCAYWINPQTVASDDTGPNSGGIYVSEYTYKWTQSELHKLTEISDGSGTLVIDGVDIILVKQDGTTTEYHPLPGYQGTNLVVALGVVKEITVHSGSIHIVRSDADVTGFWRIRRVHLACRTIVNKTVDLRPGAEAEAWDASHPLAVRPAAQVTPTLGVQPTPAPGALSMTFAIGDGTATSITPGACVALDGQKHKLTIETTGGGWASNGKLENTDWLNFFGAGAGKYILVGYTGGNICFASDGPAALALLASADPNAASNTVKEIKPK